MLNCVELCSSIFHVFVLTKVMISLDFHFLVADTQVYKMLCRSVGPSVMIELKSGKTSVLDTVCVCLCVGWELGCGWGLDALAHPSATI